MAVNIGKKDVIWSYLGYFFNLCTNIILMPFILRAVEGNELGLWYTFLSVGTLVNLLDFGFSPTLVRNVTYAWCGAKENKKRGLLICKEMSLTMLCFLMFYRPVNM